MRQLAGVFEHWRTTAVSSPRNIRLQGLQQGHRRALRSPVRRSHSGQEYSYPSDLYAPRLRPAAHCSGRADEGQLVAPLLSPFYLPGVLSLRRCSANSGISASEKKIPCVRRGLYDSLIGTLGRAEREGQLQVGTYRQEIEWQYDVAEGLEQVEQWLGTREES